jgi:hypothetical protein
MRLIHYTKNPLREVRSETQVRDSYKPNGLWVSVEGEQDWKSWCESEEFASDSFVNAYEITLSAEANVLRLRSAEELRAFTYIYGIGVRAQGDRIDWQALSQSYSGIIIAPYIWECRLDHETFWYYTWDCQSGCIWDAEAVDSVSLIQRLPKEATA